MTSPVRVALIGAVFMARHHIRQMLKMGSTTRIVVLCEPSQATALEAAKIFVDAGLPPPPNRPDWQRLIAEYGAEWGETLAVQYSGDQPPAPIRVPPSRGVWEQFLAVRSGRIPNPSPAEAGLRMAKLWDAIRASAANNGIPVRCE